MKNIEQKVINFIKGHNLLEKEDKVIVALSGGPDSVFALYFLKKYRKLFDIELFAFHLNHNLRGSSAKKDEVFSEEFSRELEIPVKIVSADVKSFAKENRLSIEEAARTIRYRELKNFATETNATKIVTAHNKNDFTETVLLNLIKGSGISGIKGIPVIRDNIIRPFLVLEKNEILNYLNEKKIQYRIDESNSENLYQRNYIRNEIIPLLKKNINSNIESSVLRSSLVIQDQVLLFEKLIEEKRSLLVNYSDEKIVISLELLEKYGVSLYNGIIRQIFSENGLEFNFQISENVNRILNNQKGKSVDLAHNFKLIRESDKLILKKMKLERVFDVIDVVFNKLYDLGYLKIFPEIVENVFEVSPDYELLSVNNCEEIKIRNWESGDRFIPLGMNNFKKVSDFLTDIKIDNLLRKNVKVLEIDGKIAYIIGFRIDERFKINKETKRALKIWKK